MERIHKRVALTLAVAIAVMIAGVSAAQQPPPKRPAPRPAPHPTEQQPASTTSDEPQRTTATYADWIVQCETRAGQSPEKVCDMAQLTEVKGKNLPFSRVAISFPEKGQIKLTVQVPVNASFAVTVRIQVSDADPGIAAPFRYCVPLGCFAEFEIKEDELKKFRAATGAGKLAFDDSGHHHVVIPLSFNGFGPAFEALAKE